MSVLKIQWDLLCVVSFSDTPHKLYVKLSEYETLNPWNAMEKIYVLFFGFF